MLYDEVAEEEKRKILPLLGEVERLPDGEMPLYIRSVDEADIIHAGLLEWKVI